jgi:hypothetical protein
VTPSRRDGFCALALSLR